MTLSLQKKSKKSSTKQYEFLPKEENVLNHAVVRITKGPDKGIEFVYGKVGFRMIDETPNLSYTYDITNGKTPKNLEKFEQRLGDILADIIQEYSGDQVAARNAYFEESNRK